MANNPLIYNGALNGATGGIHERWITSTQSTDYLAIRNRILDFADTVDQLIPTNPAITEADGSLMESIINGVLADRFINLTDDFLAIAQAIVTLWTVMRGSLEPIAIDVSSDNVIIDLSLIPPANNPFPTGSVTTLTEILIADGPYTGPGTGYPGFTTRIGYVNAASARVGSLFAGCTLQAAPAAWLTEADVPPGNIFTFRQWGSGAGGGSGGADRNGSGSFSGGGGGPGGGAACNEWTRTRADILAALPITFTVPLGADGGLGVTNAAVSPVIGNPGVNGATNSIVGTGIDERAGGGSLGGAGDGTSAGSAGSGGGRFGNGISFSQGGIPSDGSAVINTTIYNNIGGARSNSRNTAGSSGTSQYALWGGSGGGSYTNGTSIIMGGRSLYGGCGGGAGGRYSALSGLVGLATEGGGHDIYTQGAPWGGGGGLPGVAAGAIGQDGADGNASQGGCGGGGGQGNNAGTGGAGGAGGFPGGGGAGGGYGHGTATAGTSGAGGRGGDALTLITITL